MSELVEVGEVGATLNVSPGDMIEHVGGDPLHVGPSCADPSIGAGQFAKFGHEGTQTLVCATGQRARVRVLRGAASMLGKDGEGREERREERREGRQGRRSKPAPAPAPPTPAPSLPRRPRRPGPRKPKPAPGKSAKAKAKPRRR
jgi:hypothetical protein